MNHSFRVVKWAKVSSTVIEKWAKTNCIITTYHILVAFILKWEKKTSSHFEIISFINIYNKNPPKRMKWWWKRNLALNNEMRDEWDENETLHLIMMMVKNCTQKTIYIKKNKKIKKFNYYYPPSPLLSLSLLRSLKIENKIPKKMYYPWIHYAVQNWLSLNKIALQ